MTTVRVLDCEQLSRGIYDSTIDEAKLVAANDCICLQEIAKEKSIVILLPHSDASAFHAMVRLRVEHLTYRSNSCSNLESRH
jgi:hypothetical protein